MLAQLDHFSFLAASQGTKERHLVVYLIVDTRINPRYMYIHEHEDEIAQETTFSITDIMWTLLRCIMIERLSSWRGRITPRPSLPPSLCGSLLRQHLCSLTSHEDFLMECSRPWGRLVYAMLWYLATGDSTMRGRGTH